jgi:hypothetical protein
MLLALKALQLILGLAHSCYVRRRACVAHIPTQCAAPAENLPEVRTGAVHPACFSLASGLHAGLSGCCWLANAVTVEPSLFEQSTLVCAVSVLCPQPGLLAMLNAQDLCYAADCPHQPVWGRVLSVLPMLVSFRSAVGGVAVVTTIKV